MGLLNKSRTEVHKALPQAPLGLKQWQFKVLIAILIILFFTLGMWALDKLEMFGRRNIKNTQWQILNKYQRWNVGSS